MNLLPPPGKGQVLAACLVFVAGTLLYYVLFASYFREKAAINEEVAALLDVQQQARAKLAQRAKLDQRLAAIEQFATSNTYFLAEDSFDLAAAGLNSKLKQVIQEKALNQQRCSVVSSQNQRAPTDEPYERVTIQVRLRCDQDDFARVVYELENATPLLFLSELNLYVQPVYDAGIALTTMGDMDVRFDLSGYIRRKAVSP
jgi:general secretion pathway protein M